jgi:hypothetical protein
MTLVGNKAELSLKPLSGAYLSLSKGNNDQGNHCDQQQGGHFAGEYPFFFFIL